MSSDDDIGKAERRRLDEEAARAIRKRNRGDRMWKYRAALDEGLRRCTPNRRTP